MTTRKTQFQSIVILFFLGLASYGFSFFDEESKVPDAELNAELETSFDKMMAVLMHKRCVNCHPAGDAPLQGEDSHIHNFGIVRGESDHGLSGYTCESCHSEKNNNFSGVPGAPHWAVAPIGMAWEGKTRVEIAQQMMDPKRNGGRSAHDIEEHLTEHELVLWAWEPGVNAEGIPREKPPVGKEEYIAAVKDWIANGAIIPEQ